MTPERARLATVLRELRAAAGLSMAGLAAKTAYSKSSWERYLNGRTLPPRQAVQELCRLTGEPEGRCLALWEIAESEWSGRATEAARVAAPADTPSRAQAVPTPTPDTRPDPRPDPPQAPPKADRAGHRRAAAVAVLATVCAVAIGGVTVALLLLPGHSHGPRPSAVPPSPGPHCSGASCEGMSPMDMYCAASPTTLATRRTQTGAWLEVRYSRQCGASWARMWGARAGDRLRLTAGGRAHDAEVEDSADADSFVYTPMTVTRPGTVLRACFHSTKSTGQECFDSVSR
ncbi:XRE family transcriptional regulator [Streptomyces sp. NBC_00461]|uniref:helix-turn-helix domain-containing protein n=1 Tax=Streptomyces sp. NBC_00461 TaxID=2975750 RepID=UPI002E18D387